MARTIFPGCGGRIRSLRKHLELTQRQLAELADLSFVSVCKYETGKRIPQRATMERLAEVLGTSTSYLREGIPAHQAEHADRSEEDGHRLAEVVALSKRLIARVAQVPDDCVIIRVRPPSDDLS